MHVRTTPFVLYWRSLDAELRLRRLFPAIAGEAIAFYRAGYPPCEAARGIGWKRLRVA